MDRNFAQLDFRTPLELLVKLCDQLEGDCITLPAKSTISLRKGEILVFPGAAVDIALENGVLIGSLYGEFIAGLLESINPDTHLKYICKSASVAKICRWSDLEQKLMEGQHWNSLVRYVAVFAEALAISAEIQVQRPAYSIVRRMLRWLDESPPMIRRNTSVLRFISERTSLSASAVSQILSDLKKGGYIETEDGKLIKVNTLPERY